MDLEARLARLSTNIAWPPEPDLRARVRAAVLARRRPRLESRWALAAVAVVSIIALLLAYTPTRTAIADWVNLHTRITHTTTLPTPSPLGPGPIGKRLGLGDQTTLAAARQGVGWSVLVPATLGAPDEVYVQTAGGPTGGEVTLVYGTRTGIPVAGETGASVLLTEARGTVSEEFFGKIVADGTTTVTAVTVAGSQGWWIAGAPHIFFFTDSSGQVLGETMRLATNTLVLLVNGTVVRIEGNLSEQQAEQIAVSLS
jgi:hypothetical protein